MTCSAWTFVLNSLHTGRRFALGLISPDAQFVGLLPCARDRNAPTLEHRQLTPEALQGLRHELSLPFGVAPLARTSAIHQVLTADAAGLTVHYHSHQLIALVQPDAVVGVLDRFLARQVDAYGAE
jgi:hypothetical protein